MSLGHWDSHLRKIAHSYKKNHDTLIQCIDTQMENKVVIHGKNAGLHILLEFKHGLTEVEAINRAKEVGVKVYPVAPYFINPKSYKNNMVCIGFSGMSEESILQGIALLKDAWFNK
ncbi:HTH-type transcriptional regulatory protein GabR [bioreactor metagenome]|uniref:HTH-type transcriptional regulatory protein GabR n=1 Tax=bioreactor metagenome TaxID=1076179 RepID=A0A645DNA4_9ZZZZ